MSALLVAWVVCPALLLALFCGIGLGVRRLAGGALPGALVPAAGLAGAAATGGLLAGTAHELLVPALLALAAAGALAGRRGWRPDRWAAAAAGGAFALYAAPIVLSGEATIAGYIKLDDTATWLAITDRIMDGGVTTAGLAPSSYEATLAINFQNGYPVGGFAALGLAGVVLGIDPAWLFQPYLAVAGAILALALWELCRRAVAGGALRAAVAAWAAVPALLVGYYLWGGVKEILVAALAAGLYAAVARSATSSPRATAGPAVLILGLVAVAGAAGAVWALPVLALAAVTAWRRADRGPRLALAGGVAATAAVGGAIVAAGASLSPLRASFTAGDDLGNLAGPLEPAQLIGIWPASDFRFDPGSEWLAYVLMALAAAAALAGTVAAVRRRDEGLALYPAGAVAVSAVTALLASPWIEAKALAIASPGVLVAALAWLASRRDRPWALPALCALVAGVAWSAVAQWGGANLAPREQLAELEEIGERIAGEGPTLMTEYQPYGVRHFLRDADPEGASELRRRVVTLLRGGVARKGEWVDTDELQPSALAPYRTLVLRRSPRQSRPPGAFALVSSGEHYEVWQRDPARPVALARLPLGEGPSPVAAADCSEVRGLADRAGQAGGLLAAGAPAASVLFPPGGGRWTASGKDLDVWAQGSVRGEATLQLDDRPVAHVRHQLNNEGLFTGFGTVDPPSGGRHELRIVVGGADLHPGSAPDGTGLGRIVLRRPPSPDAIRRVPAANWRGLCRREWDWIEAAP